MLRCAPFALRTIYSNRYEIKVEVVNCSVHDAGAVSYLVSFVRSNVCELLLGCLWLLGLAQ